MAVKRKRGKGTIRLRKDGRWEGRVVVGYKEDGTPRTKNVLAKTKSACSAKLKELLKSCEAEKLSNVSVPSGSMSFGQWLDFWYHVDSKPRLRPTTQENYENWIYNHLTPALGGVTLEKLTQADLQNFFNQMKKGGRLRLKDCKGEELSDRSVRNCWAVCKMALEQAVQEGLISRNPVTGCKLPPKKDREMQTLSTEELRRFLLEADAEGFYELFLLELTTGLRRGELLALRWEDLDFRTGALRIDKQAHPVFGHLTISEPKTRAAHRTIILPPAVLEVLSVYREEVYSRWMFPSSIKEDSPLDPSYVRKKLHMILERSGCKNVRFHDLRHTFATMSLEHGMDVKTLSTIIGHTSAETTLDIYTHITNEMQCRAARSIDQGIAGVEREETAARSEEPTGQQEYTPYQPPRRRKGTGCVSQINEKLWEGRYAPKWIDGRKHTRCVYAPSREECEEKLAQLIRDMKRELAELKEQQKGFSQTML